MIKPAAPETKEDVRQLQAAALEAAANPIVITRRDGTIIWVNCAFEKLSGYTRAEALFQNARLVRSGQQPVSFYKEMWEAILRGEIWQGELFNRRKDGSLYHEEMTITPVKSGTGEITHFIAIKQDISGRNRSEERISRLAQVVENSTEMIAIGDPDGRITFANQALLQSTGFSESEIVGQFFGTALLSGNNPPNLSEEIRLQTASGSGWKGECRRVRKDGTDFPISLSTGTINSSQGLLIGTFGIAQDITERKRKEELHNSLFSIAAAADQAQTLDGLYRSVHQIICTVIPADSFYIALYDEQKDELQFPYYIDRADLPLTRRKSGKGRTEYVLRSGRPLLLDRSSERELQKRGAIEPTGRPTAVWLGVPLKVDKKTIGVMAVQHYTDPAAYDETHLQILENISSHVAKVIARKRAEEELRASEEYYRLILGCDFDSITVADPQGRFEFVNPAACRMFGCTREELLTMKVTDMLVDEEIPRLAQLVRNLTSGVVSNREWQTRRTDGSTFLAEVGVSLMPNGRLLGIGRDITQRKLTEETNRAQAALLDSAHDAILVRNANNEIIYWNEGAAKTYGWKREEAMGRVPPDLLQTTFPKPLREIEAELAENGVWEGELTHLCKSGTKIVVDSRWVAHRDITRRLTGTLEINRDITDRKKAEEALRLNEEHLRLAQLGASMGIFAIELPSGKQTWSPPVFEIFGIPPGTPQPSLEDMLRYTHPDDQPLVKEQSALLFAGKPIHFDHRIIRPGGETRWVEVSGKAEFDNSGRPLRYLGLCRDVTERKLLEAQLHQAQKLEAVGSLAAGVAHDFNNVLGVILGNMELLVERIPPDEISQRYLGRVRTAVNSATAVTRQLLAFSSKQILQPAILDLNAAVHELNKMTQRLIGENIRVVLSLEPDLGSVKADPGQIEQVLMNLVVNARDAMPDGGKLIIQTSNVFLDQEFVKDHIGSTSGKFIKLSVMDTGFGMDKNVLVHVFEPFFTTKEAGKGTGLGLATVYGIVKQSGGYIWVESKLGSGTTFEIYLPRLEGERITAPLLRSPSLSWGSETILLVEDEPSLREVTRAQLEKLGYRVHEAEDAEKAMDLFDDHVGEISLLLTDVIMPGMNGRVLAERLTEQKTDLRVLYMSGYTDDEIVRQGASESNQAIMIKPFAYETLASQVREALDRTLQRPRD